MSLYTPEQVKPTAAMDKAYYVRLCNMLLMPFNRQDAYRLGLIDASGNVIKEPSNATEELALTPLHKLVFGIKKFIMSKPGGFNLLQSSASALNALYRQTRKGGPSEYNTLHEEIYRDMKFSHENQLRYIAEETIIEEFIKMLEDEAATTNSPTNNTSGVDKPTLPIGQTIQRKRKNVVDGVDVATGASDTGSDGVA
jgi:hypothetical protein